MSDPGEDPGPVHAAFGHEEMQERVEVDAIAEGLDGDNDPGDERSARKGLIIERKGLDCRRKTSREEIPPENDKG